eukprot:183418-Rhodomonas_salina.3
MPSVRGIANDWIRDDRSTQLSIVDPSIKIQAMRDEESRPMRTSEVGTIVGHQQRSWPEAKSSKDVKSV